MHSRRGQVHCIVVHYVIAVVIVCRFQHAVACKRLLPAHRRPNWAEECVIALQSKEIATVAKSFQIMIKNHIKSKSSFKIDYSSIQNSNIGQVQNVEMNQLDFLIIHLTVKLLTENRFKSYSMHWFWVIIAELIQIAGYGTFEFWSCFM